MSARTPVNHRLKVLPHWFDLLIEGSKTHEVRFNDRDFQIGDSITVGKCAVAGERCLGTCSGAEKISFEITHVLPGGQFGIEPGFAVLSLAAYPYVGVSDR